jgi:hypothetical protein
MQNTNSNSANSANLPASTAETSETPTRTRARRKIDPGVISAIARLCAKSLTESEACRQIGIKPRHWFDWKNRASRSDKFAALLEEFRAGRIDSLIAKIENAADGKGLKQPDWRAAAHLLAIADAKRFSDSGMRNAVQVNVNVAAPVVDPNDPTIKALLDRAYSQAKPVEIASSVEPKQIADAP